MKTVKLPKIFFYTTGLPGAGKTTFAINLVESTNVKHISVDRIAFELFQIPTFKTETERNLVLKEADYKVEEFMWDDTPVIYDGNVNNIEWRKCMNILAKKFDVQCISIYINTPVKVSRERALTPRYGKISRMWRVLTPKQFEDKLEEFVLPDLSDNLIEISGTEEFDSQFKKVLKRIAKAKV